MAKTPVDIRVDLASYISGYADGEGCFTVSFSKREKLRNGWEVRPSFSVSQNYDRAEVLHLMKEYFGGGTIRPDRSDNTLKYEIRRLQDLIEKVIPHFEAHPLLSSKGQDFEAFRIVCKLMNDGAHRTDAGLREIVGHAMEMNPSGKRKFAATDIFDKSVSKVIVSASSNGG